MAGFAELTVEQGASYSTTVTVNGSDGSPTNLTNYTAAAQLRKSYYSSNAAATFSVSTGNDPSLGIITMSLDAANTANIYPGRYVYDVYVTSGSTQRIRVLEGIINVTPQVTKTAGML